MYLDSIQIKIEKIIKIRVFGYYHSVMAEETKISLYKCINV